ELFFFMLFPSPCRVGPDPCQGVLNNTISNKMLSFFIKKLWSVALSKNNTSLQTTLITVITALHPVLYTVFTVSSLSSLSHICFSKPVSESNISNACFTVAVSKLVIMLQFISSRILPGIEDVRNIQHDGGIVLPERFANSCIDKVDSFFHTLRFDLRSFIASVDLQ